MALFKTRSQEEYHQSKQHKYRNTYNYVLISLITQKHLMVCSMKSYCFPSYIQMFFQGFACSPVKQVTLDNFCSQVRSSPYQLLIHLLIPTCGWQYVWLALEPLYRQVYLPPSMTVIGRPTPYILFQVLLSLDPYFFL